MRVRLLAAFLCVSVAACSSISSTFTPRGRPFRAPHRSGVTLYAFSNPNGEFGLPRSPKMDGAKPRGSLTFVTLSTGPAIYGRTSAGGNATQCGIIFSIGPHGAKYRVRHRFSGNDGCNPRHDSMLPDPVFGYLWSTTNGKTDKTVSPPQDYNEGTIFSFDPKNDAVAVAHIFAGAPGDGARQRSSFSFTPARGGDAILYGQAAEGGENDRGDIYAMRLGTGSTQQLYSFAEATGYEPHGRIVLLDRTLWGLTRYGGAGDGGVAFKFDLATKTYTVVHDFTGKGADGYASDHGYLTPVKIGNRTVLYGLTQCGGNGGGTDAANCDGMGDGVVFQIDPVTGGYHTVYEFRGTEAGDAADPYGSLNYDPASGYLYGTTRNGGAADQGTVFRIKAEPFGSNASDEVLYGFTGRDGDGANPIDNVIVVDGVCYGMAQQGGASSNAGTVFAVPI